MPYTGNAGNVFSTHVCQTRKVLVFSQQSVEQDKILKGGVWYQNPFYLVDKTIFATEIDYMGLLQEQGGGHPIKRTLIADCDHQGNLMAVAVAMHRGVCCLVSACAGGENGSLRGTRRTRTRRSSVTTQSPLRVR